MDHLPVWRPDETSNDGGLTSGFRPETPTRQVAKWRGGAWSSVRTSSADRRQKHETYKLRRMQSLAAKR
eukprot:4054729-Prymnesium_polylepis.1